MIWWGTFGNGWQTITDLIKVVPIKITITILDIKYYADTLQVILVISRVPCIQMLSKCLPAVATDNSQTQMSQDQTLGFAA